jgi:hypothetical protein
VGPTNNEYYSYFHTIPKLAEKFEGMDEQFKELASLLQFRVKAKERKERLEKKNNNEELSVEDKEMDDWDREMKVSVSPFD